MRNLQNGAALIFIICVALLTIVSILGVWDFFAGDVISKSYETIGLLGLVCLIVVGAGHFLDRSEGEVMPQLNVLFISIRQSTIGVLIVSVATLALIGVLAIWEILSSSVIHKSLSSIAIIAFSALVIVMICLQRENNKMMQGKVSGGVLLLLFLAGWWLFTTIF